MRILVVNLLRLGDFIQILPVLEGLRRQYQVSELDLLTFEPVRQMAPMVPGIGTWWTLNREGLQFGLGQADVPLLTSFSLLKEKVDAINARKYDCVINLTQTHFSAWIAGLINVDQRAGLAMDVGGQAHFHSPWFRYLNDHVDLNVPDVFHHTDIFFYGCGLRGPERLWRLNETQGGQAEVAALKLDSAERIVLQLLTSDAKKTWPEDFWLQLIERLQFYRPQARFILLGAPNEAERLNALHSRAAAQDLRVERAILSLPGAFSLLRQSQLLVTCDTSIKHLANAAEIAVLELSLGSSDWRRTGAYKSDSLILQADVECAPCPHSSPCHRARHECALQLDPLAVAATAHQYLNGNWFEVKKLAKEFVGRMRWLRTKILDSGFWLAYDVNEHGLQQVVETLVERCTWKFLLNREHLDPVARYGSEGVRMKNVIENVFTNPWSDGGARRLSEHLTFLESEAARLGEKAVEVLSATRRRPRGPGVDGVIDIGHDRRETRRLEESLHQAEIKLKLIRSLKFQLTECK